jgi:hypothetical protein
MPPSFMKTVTSMAALLFPRGIVSDEAVHMEPRQDRLGVGGCQGSLVCVGGIIGGKEQGVNREGNAVPQ